MAARTASNLARLARAARGLDEKRVLCLEIQQALEDADNLKVTVSGEAWMLEQLQGRLEQILKRLQALEKSPQAPAVVAQGLDEIEALLTDAEWELAEQIRADLVKKVADRNAQIRSYEDTIVVWQTRLRELQERLNQARKVRAAVIREDRAVQRLQGLLAEAERTQREQRYDDVGEMQKQLGAEEGQQDKISKDIADRTAEVEAFVRQADLLLLQSPLMDQRYQYTVLLRTPSTPGSHGINIQGSSTLVQQDRQWMGEVIGEITSMINAGLARQFALRQGEALPEVAELAPLPEPAPEPEPELDSEEETRHIRLLEPAAGRLVVQDVNAMAQKVGDMMYRLLMPEDMQRYLDDNPCSITITTNDLELPWELMCYEDKFLCLQRPVGRMPMGRTLPREEERRPPNTKPRFLLVYSDPAGNLPAAEREINQIYTGLEKDWKEQIEIEVVTRERARGRWFNEVLRSGSYDVIHYAGHAAFHKEDPELSGLLLYEDEVFFAQKIRRLLEGQPLVFLNACESGRTANEQQPQQVGEYLQQPAEGLASYFIYGGARGCIGALWPVYDDAAAQFAIQFYNGVLEGHMLGEAMRRARNTIRKDYPNQITWAAYVLYGDPIFCLVS